MVQTATGAAESCIWVRYPWALQFNSIHNFFRFVLLQVSCLSRCTSWDSWSSQITFVSWTGEVCHVLLASEAHLSSQMCSYTGLTESLRNHLLCGIWHSWLEHFWIQKSDGKGASKCSHFQEDLAKFASSQQVSNIDPSRMEIDRRGSMRKRDYWLGIQPNKVLESGSKIR